RFFFNVPARAHVHSLSLHDALPIFRALNGRFNTSITHAYSIVIGSKHITLNATGGGFLTASKQFRHGATSKSRSNTVGMGDAGKIGRAVQQECRDRYRMPSSARKET